MNKSLALIELKTTPIGLLVADEMLKSSNVSLVMANPVCPGKYIVIVSGDVGAVENAIKAGISVGGSFVVNSHMLHNIDNEILPALSGTVEVKQLKAVGIIETMSAISSINIGDVALKASNITLLEIRMARGLGGKAFIVFTGEISAVRAASENCLEELKETGDLVSNVVISAPHKDLIKALY